jgi:hypothetical protein
MKLFLRLCDIFVDICISGYNICRRLVMLTKTCLSIDNIILKEIKILAIQNNLTMAEILIEGFRLWKEKNNKMEK